MFTPYSFSVISACLGSLLRKAELARVGRQRRKAYVRHLEDKVAEQLFLPFSLLVFLFLSRSLARSRCPGNTLIERVCQVKELGSVIEGMQRQLVGTRRVCVHMFRFGPSLRA